jgi:hypothetical protein
MFNDAIEDAPNFNPMSVEDADQHFAHLPFNRIKVNFDLPAIYWYERFSWATLRAVHPAFVHMDVPAYAITYSMGELLKPWYWYAYPLLENNAPWLDVRLQLPGEASSWHWACVRRLVLLVVLCALLAVVDRRVRDAASLAARSSSSALLAAGASGGSGNGGGEKSFLASTADAAGFGGLACAFFGAYCALLPFLAPGLMPPRDAYLLGFAAYPLAIHASGLACSKACNSAAPPPAWLVWGPLAALSVFYVGMGYHPWYDMGTGVPPAMRTLTVLLLAQLNVVAVALYLRLAADPKRLGPGFVRDKAVRLPR